MKIIIFTLLMIPGTVTSISVTGYSGGVVNITCRYENKYTENAKYVCKVQKLKCSELIRTGTKDKWVHSGRFSLYDNKKCSSSQCVHQRSQSAGFRNVLVCL